jgi:hypothetical protein
MSLSLILQPTVSRPVYLGIKHPSGAYDQILLPSDSCGFVDMGQSRTRGRVCRLQLLLVLASAVTFGSESRGTRHHILLSQLRDFSFRRLLRLALLRWRYSAPPPYGSLPHGLICPSFIIFREPCRNHHVEQLILLCYSSVATGMFLLISVS